MKDKERYKEARFVGYLSPALVKKAKEYMAREDIISKSVLVHRAVKALLENEKVEQKRR